MARTLAIIETLSFFGEGSAPPRPTPAPIPPGPVDPGWGYTPPVDPGYGIPAWGAGHPAHPIAGTPVYPSHPIAGGPPLYPSQGLPWAPGHPSHPIAGGPPVYPSHPIYRPDKPLPIPLPPDEIGGGPGDATKPTPPPQYLVVWIPGLGYVLRPFGGLTKPVEPPEAAPKK